MTKRFLKDFSYHSDLNMFVHPEVVTTAYRDGGEQYVFEVLKEAREISACSPGLSRYIRDWPSRYHLSTKRINLLESVKEILDSSSRVLEIGCGTGVMTRWLGENLREVDAIEGENFRARITRERTRDLGNVNVFCGDILNTALKDQDYGLVTIVGVLEYIPVYDRENVDPFDSCLEFLKRISDSLKGHGILLLAIENKLGVKYLTGCKEDHTGRLFEGVCDYPGKALVTFSRNELETILLRSGFENIQFYHLFPDYKLLETVIREDDRALSLYPHNWIRTPFEDYSGYRFHFMMEPLFLKSLTEAKLLWHFSNSFLVLCSKSKSTNVKTEWLIKKFSTHENLKPNFRHAVSLKEDAHDGFIVERAPLPHGEWHEKSGAVAYRLEPKNQFVAGDSLAVDFYKAVLCEDYRKRITSILIQLKETLMARYATEKVDEDGYPLVSGEALDYTFFNLIKDNDGDLRFIDRKWRFRRELPSDYILFRNLYHVHAFLGPFIKEKDPREFVSSILTDVYPKYDPGRIRRCCSLEEEFQSAVNLDQVRISLDPRPIFSVEQTMDVLDSALTKRDDEVSRLSQELKARERQLTETVQTVGKMTEGLAILKRLIQRLIEETVSAELLGDAGELCLKLGMIDTGQALFKKSRSLDSQKNHGKNPKFSKSGRRGSARPQSPNHPE